MFTKAATIKPAKKNGHHPAFAGNECADSSFIPSVQTKLEAEEQQQAHPFIPAVQPKLNIGKPNDKYEVEADQVADKVVNGPNSGSETAFFAPAPIIQKKENQLQKQEEDQEIQEKPIAQSITPIVQLEAAEEDPIQEKADDTIQKQEGEEEVQTKTEDEVQTVQTKREGPNNLGVDISNRIQVARSNGSPLAASTRLLMEDRFGADFSGVRIHTGADSAFMNRELGARAFTTDNDIFFNEGEFDPQSNEGQMLLAHELTHTIQQGASPAAPVLDQDSEVATSDNLIENNLDIAGESTPAEAENSVATVGDTIDPLSPMIEMPETTSEVIEEEMVTSEGLEDIAATSAVAGSGEEVAAESIEDFPMSPEEDPAFTALENRVEGTAEDQQTTNPAEQETQAAQSAAAVPSNERMGGAQANQVAVMDEQEPVEFDAVAFKARLMERIASMQLPENQEEATEFEDNNNIQEISTAASEDASQAQEATAGPIAEATEAAPNVDAVQEREVVALPEAPIGQAPRPVNANTGMPSPRPDTQVSQPLQENMQEVDQQMVDNEVTEEQLAQSNEPEFMGALDSRSVARANTEAAPAQFRNQETQSLDGSQQQAENRSGGTLEEMHGDRSTILNEVVGQQTETGAENTTERERVSNEINDIYETAKTDVEAILEDLDTKVSEKFDAAAKKAKQKFEDYVEREMDDYKDRRYSGIRGAARWVVDKFTGLPDEVNQFFTDGRALYIAEVDTALTDISNYIGTRLTEAKNRIERGKQEVTDYVEALPENLQSIGQEASDEIQDKFDQLTDDVNSKQDELIDSLAQQYNDSLSEVDARIEEMQAANRGLIDAALDAINGVIETIRQLKQLISDLMSEIQSSMGIIMADPIGFVSNLFDGVKQGFDNFVGNIQTHLIAGFMQWLTGALGPIGITIPEDLFSLKGIFSLVMQVLGLTWDYMREKAVKLMGERVVSALEFGFEMFQIIREKGVEGIWEYIKEQFTDLKETIIDSIKELLITQVIEAGIKWLVGLLIPGAGFIKAVMAIKDFIVFFVQSALMLIPTLIEAIRALASGSMNLVAAAVERGLATLLPLVIKLFARIIGLDGLVKKVQKIIKKVRKRIDRAINKLILKAKKAGRRLLRRLTGRGAEDDDGPDERTDEEKEQDVKLATMEAEKYYDDHEKDPSLLRAELPQIKAKYKLKEIELEPIGESLKVVAEINPKDEEELDGKNDLLGKWLNKKVIKKNGDLLKRFIDDFDKDLNKEGGNKVYVIRSSDEGHIIVRGAGFADTYPSVYVVKGNENGGNEDEVGVLNEGSESTYKPTHKNFIPQQITIKQQNGVYNATYETLSSDGTETANFTIEISFEEAVEGVSDRSETRIVEGDNLSNKTEGIGRGAWDSASGGFHNAHIIGDQFGGSGKNAALNIHPSSPRYNTGDMANVENSIARFFRRSNQNYNMRVTAELTDDNETGTDLRNILDREFKADSSAEIQESGASAELIATAENKLIQKLQRAITKDLQELPAKFTGVTYSSESLTSGFEMSDLDATDENTSRTVTEQGDNQNRTKVVNIGEDTGFNAAKETFKNTNVSGEEESEPA